MEEKQIEQECEKINYELGVNKPSLALTSPQVVKRREFLLFAQVHLSNILDAKFREAKWAEGI